ncbi:Hypothetical protein R9X50_00482900 [Acrodontium crateriforme]|uniref:Autophagy-related protein 14 n=1 Tax=Acrodontium crateriforme TaxID=150365 RepID=A0AAQ3M610_9PEZI|nr:Hypothetical protein R9X50_00482900 [Acrodontium crateriforme]
MAVKTATSLQQTEGLERRDRPFLLPYNRKLRNLVSISLRNLLLNSPSHSRQRGKTIDDDALPNSLKSPAKIVALREQKLLGHSRSSSDLQRVAEHPSNDSISKENDNLVDNNNEAQASRTPKRPPLPRPRRRNTLEWVNATPQSRQEKWESATAERLADIFFSLHVHGIEEPIYISETVDRTINPTFRHVDFSHVGPSITRLDHLIVRFWAKRGGTEQWIHFLESRLHLPSLHFLGKSLDRLERPLPQNAVIMHLVDGVYTSFDSVSSFVPPPAAPQTQASSPRVLPTSSFDVLLRLAKLDDSIQDALATRDKIATELDRLLNINNEVLSDRDKVAEAEDRLKTIEYARKTVQKQLEKAHRQQNEKRSSIKSRRELMRKDVSSRDATQDEMHGSTPEVPIFRDDHSMKTKAIQNQRRRICEDLQSCFFIEPVPKQSLAFTIRSLHLPNSENLDAETPEVVAAALGHAAHVLLLLSFYLAQPLPYPVNPRSSTSTIYDPISLLKTNSSISQTYKDERVLRTYPLFSKSVPRFRFEYAVFLLNKDIQVLLECVFNVRVVDIRQTLPNLKYLLYVATAGEGELPARKAGGVRGLLRGRIDDGNSSIRSQSQDSTSGSFSGRFWHGNSGNGKPKGAVESLRTAMEGRGRKA